MPAIILLLLSVITAYSQTAVTGLGGSTANMVDRDGDGYGPGPPVIVNTTVSATINSGAQTVTPASMTAGTTTATTYNYVATGATVTSMGVVSTTGGSGFKSGSGSVLVGSYIVIPNAGCPTVATVANACSVLSVSTGSSLQLTGTFTAQASPQTATWPSVYVNLTSIVAMEPGEAITTATSGLLTAPTTVIGSHATNSGLVTDVLLSPAPLLPFSGQTVTLSIGVNMRLRVYQLDSNSNVLWPGDSSGNGHMEYVQVSAVTSTTFTATFSFTHTSGTGTIHVTDLRSLGPDADDLDATVHTAAQGIAKYGTLTAFIKALYTPSRGYNTGVNADYAAYTATRFWCLSPSGVDGTVTVQATAQAACASPYLTWTHIASSVTGSDMVIMRANYNGRITPPSGSSGSPTVLLGYPGEWPVFDSSVSPSAECGPSIATCGIFIQDKHDVIVDGVRFANSLGAGGGVLNMGEASTFITSHAFHDIIIRRVDAGSGLNSGNQSCWVSQEGGFQNLFIEDTACHDSAEHGMYIGANYIPATGLHIWRDVLFNNG